MAAKGATPEATPDDGFGYAEGWKPAEGDVIRGTVTTLDNGYSEFGQYPIVTLETEDGPVAVHAFHAALRNKLRDVKPAIGNKLAIKYVGHVEPKAGKFKFHKYIVKSDAVQQGFWDSQPEPEPAVEDDDDIPF